MTPEEEAKFKAKAAREQHRAGVEKRAEQKRIDQEAQRIVNAETRQATAPPEILTLRERLARPRPATQWRIVQLQAIGHRVLLAAQFKAGKTTLAANVARAVLDGAAFLDTYDVSAIEGVLVLFDFEMASNQLDGWYEDQKIVNDDRLLVIPMRGAAGSFNIVDNEVRDHWVTLLKARGVKYLILDCLRPLLDALGLNEHTEAGLFLTALDALLRDADIPEALVIQHMGHANERARGDSRLLDWPDVGWTLVREKEDDPASARFFKAYGRGVDVPETQLAYSEKTRRLAVVGGSRRDAKANEALPTVLAFIASAAEPPGRNAILKGLKESGYTQGVLIAALKSGIHSGHIAVTSGANNAQLHHLTHLSDGAPKEMSFL